MHTIVVNSDARGYEENITDHGHVHDHKDILKLHNIKQCYLKTKILNISF